MAQQPTIKLAKPVTLKDQMIPAGTALSDVYQIACDLIVASAWIDGARIKLTLTNEHVTQ